MASPQLENGYTKIANDILKALAKSRLPGNETQCLMVIFLHTYTWHKVVAEIRNKTFAEMTNIHPKHICRALKNLEEKSIIFITKDGNKTAPTYRFNKDFEKWSCFPKMGTNDDQEFENIINSCKPVKNVPKNGNKNNESIPKFGNKNPENVPKNGNKVFPKLGTSIPKNGNILFPKMVTFENLSFYMKEIERNNIKKEKERAVILSRKYVLKIQPKNRSYERSISNLKKHFKNYSFQDLNQAIENYFSTLDMSEDPKFRKDPANFFGSNEKPFLDYLPETFEPPEHSPQIPKLLKHNIDVSSRVLERRRQRQNES